MLCKNRNLPCYPHPHGKHTNNMSCNAMSQTCQHRMFFPLRFMFCGTFYVHVPPFSFSNVFLVLLHQWSFRSLKKTSILLASLILQQFFKLYFLWVWHVIVLKHKCTMNILMSLSLFVSHPRALAHPSTSKVLQAKECTPTFPPSTVFTFGLAVEFIKELGGALVWVWLLWSCSLWAFYHGCIFTNACKCIINNLLIIYFVNICENFNV
jgi:hypothetical protein